MRSFARITTGVIGLLFASTGIQWVVTPDSAAATLYLEIPENVMARSTLIGDFAAFFMAAATMCWIGAFRQQAIWLRASALLIGSAAVFRLSAFFFHGAGLPYELVAIEVICATFLVWAAPKVHFDRRHRHVSAQDYSSEI